MPTAASFSLFPDRSTMLYPEVLKLGSNRPGVWAIAAIEKLQMQINAKGTHISREAIWFWVEVDRFMRFVFLKRVDRLETLAYRIAR